MFQQKVKELNKQSVAAGYWYGYNHISTRHFEIEEMNDYETKKKYKIFFFLMILNGLYKNRKKIVMTFTL